MTNLLERMMKTGASESYLFEDASFLNNRDFVETEIPVLNLAFSGEIKGGFSTGLTVIAGESKTFKSALSLYCMKAYLEKYKEGIGIFYDTEGGINKSYIETFGLDTKRILYVPVEHVEQLKFDMIKKLEEIKKGDKVFFLVDSIGQIPSKKEVEDALDEKSVADMTRAKAIKSLLRMIVLQLNKKDIPCFMINHVYNEMGLFPKIVLPGGKGVTYSANCILIITKSQEKNSDGDLIGYTFNIQTEKSRFVKEKSKFSFTALYGEGINKWSGLVEDCEELGYIQKKGAWYLFVDKKTGELSKNYRYKELIECNEKWLEIINNPEFKEAMKKKYSLG